MENNGDNGATCAKKPKLEGESIKNLENIHNDLKDLSNFKDIEVLNNNTNRKTVCLKGKFSGKDGIGLVLLEKTAFTNSNLTSDKYFITDNYLKKEFSNDIYGNYNFYPKTELNGKLTIDNLYVRLIFFLLSRDKSNNYSSSH